MQSKKQPFVRWTRELGGKQTNKQTPKKEYLEWNKIMLAVLYNNFLRRNHLIAVNTVFIIAGTYSYSFVAFIKSQIELPPHTHTMFIFLHTHRDTYIYTGIPLWLQGKENHFFTFSRDSALLLSPVTMDMSTVYPPWKKTKIPHTKFHTNLSIKAMCWIKCFLHGFQFQKSSQTKLHRPSLL